MSVSLYVLSVYKQPLFLSKETSSINPSTGSTDYNTHLFYAHDTHRLDGNYINRNSYRSDKGYGRQQYEIMVEEMREVYIKIVKEAEEEQE